MASTNRQTRGLGRPRFFEKLRCCSVVKRCWQQMVNVSDFGGKLDSACYLWEGSAGEAGCQGGERGVVLLIEFSKELVVDCVSSWTLLRKGWRIYGLPPLPPTSECVVIWLCVGVLVCL